MVDTSTLTKTIQLNEFSDKLGQSIFGEKWDKNYLKLEESSPEFYHRFNGDVKYFLSYKYIKSFLEVNLHRSLSQDEEIALKDLSSYTTYKIIPISIEAINWYIDCYNIIEQKELEIFKTIKSVGIENYKIDNARYISNLICNAFISGEITTYYSISEEPYLKVISPYLIQGKKVLFKFSTGHVRIKNESLFFQYLTDDICLLKHDDAMRFIKKRAKIHTKLNEIQEIVRFKAVKHIFYQSFIKLYNNYAKLFNNGEACTMPEIHDVWNDVRDNVCLYQEVIIHMDKNIIKRKNEDDDIKTVKFKATRAYIPEFKKLHKIEEI